MQDGTPFDVSGSAYDQSASQGFGNLPSRQKQPGSQYLGSSNYPGNQGSQQGQSSSSSNPSPRTDETGLWTNIDVDFTPDVSDRHPSASDKASVNSSTNSPFTPPGINGPLPPIQQQTSPGTSSKFSSSAISAPGVTVTSQTSGDASAEISPFAQFLPETTEAPRDTSGAGNQFPLSAGWDYRQSVSGSVHLTEQRAPDSDTIGEGQWAQILGDMSWENWRS